MNKLLNIMKDERIKAIVALGLFVIGSLIFISQTTLNGHPLSSLLFNLFKVL